MPYAPMHTKKIVIAVLSCCLGFFLIQMICSAWLEWDGAADAALVQSVFSSNPSKLNNETELQAAAAQLEQAPVAALHEAPSADRVLALADPSESDPEWAKLARTTFKLVVTTNQPKLLVGRELFRNVHLNPADTHVPADRRTEFDAWLVRTAAGVAKLRQSVDVISRQELDFMIQRGIARRISYSKYMGNLTKEERARIQKVNDQTRRSLESAGISKEMIDKTIAATKSYDPKVLCAGSFCHATRDQDDNIYMGDLKRMPQTRQAAELYSVGVWSMYTGVLNFFRTNAGLIEDDCEALMEPIDTELVRFRV